MQHLSTMQFQVGSRWKLYIYKHDSWYICNPPNFDRCFDPRITMFFWGGLEDTAYLSSCLLLLITLGAMVGSWFFERRIWCRHLCPIGGMNGLYAKLAVTELRAQNGHLVVSPGWSHQNQLICINVSTTLKNATSLYMIVHRRVTLYIWTTIRIYPDW